MRFDIFARTEVGVARERNEDSFAVIQIGTAQSGLRPDHRGGRLGPPGTIVAVCDGMGGAAAGDLAASLALTELHRAARSLPSIDSAEQAETLLVGAVREANRTVLAHAKAHPDKRGMGTTLTAAVLYGREVTIVQVGDSRAYLKRGAALVQLTVDHSVVGQMVASGRLTPEEARRAKQRNLLLEAIGVQARIGPDVISVHVDPEDVLLVCSDGLNGPLGDDEILAIMTRHSDPVRCCRALTEAACVAGGPDNVTVVVARFIADTEDPTPFHGPVRFSRRSVLPPP